MSLRDLNALHLRLVATYAGRHALRSAAGVVFGLVMMYTGLLMAHVVLIPIDQMTAMADKDADLEAEAHDAVLSSARPVVEWLLGDDDIQDLLSPMGPTTPDDPVRQDARAWAKFLLEDRPALLSVIFILFSVAVPLLVVMGTFNQVSGDIGTKGIRYILLRTERTNIFFGRFLGMILFTAVGLSLLIAVIVGYLGLKLDLYAWPELLRWGAWGWLALTILAIPYIALCAFMSTLVDSPFGSLLLCYAGVASAPVLGWIGATIWEPLENIKYVLPWGTRNFFFHPDWGKTAVAFGVCAACTIVFLGLGHRRICRRDL